MNAKPLPLLLAALLLSVVAGAVTSVIVTDGSASAGEAPSSDELARLSGLVERLAEDQRTLSRRVEDLSDEVAMDTGGDARLPVGEIDAAVARYMAAGAPQRAGDDGAVPAEVEADMDAAKQELVQAALARLDSGELNEVEIQEAWKEFADQGISDLIVAEYEARAEREPNDPDVQVELGEVYLQKIFEVGNSPLAGVWATKADKAFDAALELDERHWSARFNKAVSLSFWPPVFGKQGEAIQHFETLVAQQAGGAPEARHAQTHLLLGNMYQQTGNMERAIEAWRGGLALFPDDEALRAQLELANSD